MMEPDALDDCTVVMGAKDGNLARGLHASTFRLNVTHCLWDALVRR